MAINNPAQANAVLLPLSTQTTNGTGANSDGGLLSVGTVVTGGTIPGIDRYTSAELMLQVLTVSGTSPTLNVYIQKLMADGATWCDLLAFTQATTSTTNFEADILSSSKAPFVPTNATLAAGTLQNGHIGNTWRVKWTVGGTSPSFAFSVFGNLYA